MLAFVTFAFGKDAVSSSESKGHEPDFEALPSGASFVGGVRVLGASEITDFSPQ